MKLGRSRVLERSRTRDTWIKLFITQRIVYNGCAKQKERKGKWHLIDQGLPSTRARTNNRPAIYLTNVLEGLHSFLLLLFVGPRFCGQARRMEYMECINLFSRWTHYVDIYTAYNARCANRCLPCRMVNWCSAAKTYARSHSRARAYVFIVCDIVCRSGKALAPALRVIRNFVCNPSGENGRDREILPRDNNKVRREMFYINNNNNDNNDKRNRDTVERITAASFRLWIQLAADMQEWIQSTVLLSWSFCYQ